VAEPRIGLGFDVHAQDVRRPLMLGGVAFPGEAGLAGHSDGDAVCHAIADALLGAAGLGDIGEHFREDDPDIAGIPGLELLARTVSILADRGLAPASCDATVIAERPAIAPERGRMRANLAGALGVEPERISVKGSRPEGLGLAGSGAGCLALVALRST